MRNTILSLSAAALGITTMIAIATNDAQAGGYARGGRGGFVAAGPRGFVAGGPRGGVVAGGRGGVVAVGGVGRQFYGNNGWGGNWGPAAGVGVGLGALAVGAAIANSGNYGYGYGSGYYDSAYNAYPACYIVRRRVVDEWGNLLGVRRVRVCD